VLPTAADAFDGQSRRTSFAQNVFAPHWEHVPATASDSKKPPSHTQALRSTLPSWPSVVEWSGHALSATPSRQYVLALHSWHASPTREKPASQRQSATETEPAAAVEKSGHRVCVFWSGQKWSGLQSTHAEALR